MPDVKFSCPHCQQHIQADSGYGGMQINCPACNGSLVVPGTAIPSAPAMAPAPVPVPVSVQRQAPSPAVGGGCPSCGGAMPRGAVLCTNCGYNTATRQRTVAGRPAAMGKPSAPQYEAVWYKTAYPYVGAVAVLLALLYFLGRGNPIIMLAFFGMAVLYILTVQIIVLVAAFKESVGMGFLVLCLPITAFYFVFKVQDNDTIKILYAGVGAIEICFAFMK
ncbi:MAG: hypothetical protein JWR69_2126 [Pedosphaera sp.]|nr:hypothetical protein [Pedosphaera sp.]